MAIWILQKLLIRNPIVILGMFLFLSSKILIDSRNYFGSNKCTVDRNGKPINNGTSNVDLTTNAMAATFIYVDSTCGWNYLSKAT